VQAGRTAFVICPVYSGLSRRHAADSKPPSGVVDLIDWQPAMLRDRSAAAAADDDDDDRRRDATDENDADTDDAMAMMRADGDANHADSDGIQLLPLHRTSSSSRVASRSSGGGGMRLRVVAMALVASIGGVLFGYDIGACGSIASRRIIRPLSRECMQVESSERAVELTHQRGKCGARVHRITREWSVTHHQRVCGV
jgi:hypothetical protein